MTSGFKALPEELKPREKLKRYGAKYLGNDELLAILLQSGTKDRNVLELAREILKTAGGLAHLSELTLKRLEAIKGMGLGKASIILSAIELSRRLSVKPIDRPVMTELLTIVEVFSSHLSSPSQESFLAMYLDLNYRLIFSEELYRGSDNFVCASPKLAFSQAMKHSASKLIIAHTHPSGSLVPSEADLKLTRTYIKAGSLLDIELVDHLIIGYDKSYLSLRCHDKALFSKDFLDE